MAKYIDKFDPDEVEIDCDNCKNAELCDNYDLFQTDDIIYMDGDCGNINGKHVKFVPYDHRSEE